MEGRYLPGLSLSFRSACSASAAQASGDLPRLRGATAPSSPSSASSSRARPSPPLAVFGWESIHFLLPPLLKKASVIHYLQSLCPVPVSEGPFAMLADAPNPWFAVPGLLIFAALMIFVSAMKIRRMEITYEEE